MGLIAVGLFGLSSEAGAVDGPGIGALTYQSSEVTGQAPLKVIYSTCKDYPSAGNSSPRNNSHVLMHRGWLISVMAIDSGKVGGGIEVYDFANPRNPVLKKTKCDSSTNPLRESHTYGVWRNDADGKEYLALTSTKGVQIWDVTNLPNTLTLVNDYSLPSVTANDYADGSWWLSWVGKYIYVGGSGNGMYTVDASNPASMKLYDPYNLCWHGVSGCVGAPLKPVDIGDFRTNVVQVVGNVMLVGGADTAPGMAMFDLTDPLKPVYRQKISTPSQSYNYQLAGKWGDVNTLLAFKGTGSSSGLQIIQVSNDLRTLTSLYNNSALVNSKIGYLNYQDGYFHGGYSSNYKKIDVRNPTAPVVTKTGKSSQAGVDEDFATVLGNVVFAGNDHDGSKEGEHNGSAIYAHQTNPDTTAPAVTYITPNVGATGQKASVRVGVIFSDNVDLRYLNTTTFAVKNAGTGATLPGRYTAQFHYANFEPNTPFAAGTTYNVVITGVRDWAGNAMTATFNSSFTITGTGATPPANCNIGTDSIKNVGQTVTITPTGCTGSPAPTCTIDWGDGSQSGSFPCATPSGNTHVYSSPLHYLVAVHATNASGEMTFSRRQTVINAPTSGQPTRSTPIFYAKAESGVWGDSNPRLFVANPDRNSVRGFTANVTTGVLTAAWEKDVGRNPRTLAARPTTNQVWIVSQDEPSIKVLNGVDGTFLGIIVLPDASRPYGIAFSPTGSHAYVTLQGSGKLIKIDAAFAMANQNQQKYSTPDPTVGSIVLGGQPRGVAVSGDGLKAYVTRFITPVSLNVADNKPTSPGGLVNVVNTGAMTLAGGITILNDTDPVHDTESNGRGMANYLQGITLSPDGTRATVASKKDNIYRGSFVDGQALTFENTVRTMVSILDLTQALPATDVFAYRRDINNADMANSAVYNSNGDWVFIAHHNNQVSVYDALNYNATNVMALETTGMTPQGLAISNDNKFLYVFAFMSRTVEVYNVSAVGGTNNFPKVQSISAQTSEALPTGTPKQDILAGKKIFYNSDDTKMSRDGYIACSSCHLEGGGDETVFDFTNGGEGLRNTVTLLGRRGMGHGPVHWSANFDEIQDFEHPIRDLFGGTGFMLESDFEVGTRNTPLGTAKAGVSDDLDNLAAYVASLSIVPRSPHRNADGTLTNAAVPAGSAVRGRTAFAATRTGLASGATSCASCHSGRDFTDSASKKLHNVGTLATGSGKRLGATLTGIDTPSLLGIWNTAPYLHNGSAATIMNVLNNTTHVGSVSAQEKTDLAEYMRQVDDMSRDFMFSNLIVNDTANAALWSFKGDLGSGDFAYPDRAYSWTYVPSDTRGGAAPFITLKDSVWIRTPAGSKSFGPVTATIATFNVDKPVDVYLVMDERQFIGCPANSTYPYLVPPQPARNSACIAVPSWLSSDGWLRQDGQGSAGDLEHLPMHVVQTDGYQFDMWVYKKQFGAGTVTLKAAPNTNVPFYSVVVKATPSGSLPPVPTGVAATDNEDRQSTITWMASTGAEDYTVQKSSSPSGPFTDIPGAQHITATSYVATGLTNGITYYFAVKANNDFGSSAASASDAGTPNCSAPASPSGLVANAGPGQVTLSWTAISGATGYNIKRSTTQGASDPPTVASPVTNLYTDKPLTAQTTYYFRVSATNACGESNDSAETEATPTAVTTTDALLVVKDRDAAAGGVQLTAGDVLIQAHLADLGYNIAVVQDSASTSLMADNKAVVFISRSVGSGQILAKFDTVAVPVIHNEGAVFLDNRLSNSEPGSQLAETQMTVSNSSSPLVAGLDGDVTVMDMPARLTVGVPLASADKAFTRFNDPTLATVFGYDTGAALTTGTAPARRLAFFFDDNDVNTILTCKDANDNYLSDSTACHANATTWDLFGAAIAWATNTGTAAPAAPTSLSATAGAAKIDLAWTGSTGASNYKVYRGDASGGPYVNIATVSTLTHSDTAVINNHPYYYVVTATNASGQSAYSNEVVRAIGCTLPPAPANIDAVADATGKATVAWDIVTTANSYKVKRSSTSGSGYSIVASSVTTTQYVNSGLTVGGTYYYKVSAVNACGEGSDSAELTVKLQAATPAAAVAPTFTPGGGATTYYTSTQNVTISTTTTGAYIRYTTDGSTPSPFNGTRINGTSGSVSISSSRVLKAVAYKPGWYANTSTVTSAPFIIVTSPTHDTFVRQNQATSNCNNDSAIECGAAVIKTMEVKKDTTTGNSRIAYMMWDISNLPSTITSAKVRIYGKALTTAKDYGIYSVAGTTWTETTMTYDTRPAVGATALSVQNVPITTAAYRDWDVTAYVQQQKTAGATKVSFALQLQVDSSEGPAQFNSDENGANKPQLAAY